MIQKSTILTPIDKSGALSVNLFHIYGGRKKEAVVGNFIKVNMKYVIVELSFTFRSLKFIKNHKLDLYRTEELSTLKYQYWKSQRNITFLLGIEPRFTGWKPAVLTARR